LKAIADRLSPLESQGLAGYMNDMADELESPAERRRARLRFRAQRRGFKEVDLIFGTFAELHLAALTEAELDAFETLMDAPDRDVFAWLKGAEPVPEAYDSSVFAKLKALCERKRPSWNV